MLTKNIVLLHGWGASVEKLKKLEDGLKKLGWKVLTPKIPGFKREVPKQAWGLKDYADFVISEVRKELKNQKFLLFGHSFGGRIAIKTALIHPEKLNGIVLCASGGLSRGKPAKKLIFFILAKLGKVFLVLPGFAKLWKKLLYKAAREHDYEKASGIMKDIFKKIVAEELRPVVKKTHIPALILWGKMDKMTPYSDALFLKNNISNSKLVSFSGQGHKLPYDKPNKLAKVIDKWTQSLNNY